MRSTASRADRPWGRIRAGAGIVVAAVLLLVSCGKPSQEMSVGGRPSNAGADPRCAPNGPGTVVTTIAPPTSTAPSTTTSPEGPPGSGTRPVPLGSPVNVPRGSMPVPPSAPEAPGSSSVTTTAVTRGTAPCRTGSTVTTVGTAPVAPGTALPDQPPGTTPAGPQPSTTVYAGAAGALTIGGPGAVVGNDIDGGRCPQSQPTETPPCGPQPMYWAAINGPFAAISNGDPYAVRCADATTPTGDRCARANPLYRPTGYAFAIDVAPDDVGRPLTLSAYDIGAYERTVSKPRTPGPSRPGTTAPPPPDCQVDAAPFSGSAPGFTGQNCQTGDFGKPQNFDLEVFEPGGPDGAVRFDRALPSCHLRRSAAELAADPDRYENRWLDVCTITPREVGVYALRVRNSGLPDLTDSGDGINAYALRVRGGAGTRLYPVGEQSVYMNGNTSTALLPIAGVPSKYAGRSIVLDAYDPGDGGSNEPYTLAVVPPPDSQPYGSPGAERPACTFNPTRSAERGPSTPDVAQGCQVTTHTAGGGASNLYNGAWLRIVVQIDPAYHCDGTCFWYLQYNFGSTGHPTDRVVWSAEVG